MTKYVDLGLTGLFKFMNYIAITKAL